MQSQPEPASLKPFGQVSLDRMTLCVVVVVVDRGTFLEESLFFFLSFHCMSSAVAPVLQKNSKVSKWIHRQCQGILSGLFFKPEAASRDPRPSLTSAQHQGESSVSALWASPSAAAVFRISQGPDSHCGLLLVLKMGLTLCCHPKKTIQVSSPQDFSNMVVRKQQINQRQLNE